MTVGVRFGLINNVHSGWDALINMNSKIDMDFFDTGSDGDRPTWPPAGSASLVIIDKFEPLFTSATWTLEASVDGNVIIAKSNAANQPHTPAFIVRWSRQLIRTKYDQLRQYGIDADGEYVRLGGDPTDLDP